MPTKLTDFLLKLADNAHLGKLGTDLAPGIILTFGFLILLNRITTLDVFPYGRLGAYQKRADSVEVVIASIDSQRRVLEDSIISGRLVAAPALRDPRVLRALVPLFRDQLRRLEERRTAEANSFAEFKKQATDAASLAKNLEVLGEHFTALFIIGFMAGVLMAQVSGAVFYNGFFYKYFKKSPKFAEVNNTLYSSADARLKDADAVKHRTVTYYQLKVADEKWVGRLPDLDVTYFRYLEVAMNMILPVGFLGVALLVTAGPYPGPYTSEARWGAAILALLCFGTAALLYRNARGQYVGYMLKKADVLQAVQEAGGFKPKLPA